MLNKSSFSKLARDIFHSKHTLRSPQIMHPAREWFLGVCIALGLLGGCIFLSIQTYFEYRNIDLTVDSSGANTATVYKASLIEAALGHFEGKSAQHTELRNAAMSFIVPDENQSTEAVEDDEVEEDTSSTTEAVIETPPVEVSTSTDVTEDAVSSSTVSE